METEAWRLKVGGRKLETVGWTVQAGDWKLENMALRIGDRCRVAFSEIYIIEGQTFGE